MTFIQPNKNSNLINTVLFLLAFLLVGAALSLIILYNRFVNFEHGVSEIRLQLKQIQAQSVEAENKIFSLIDLSKSENLFLGKLVPEKNPAYFEVDQKWFYASQY